MKTTPSKTVSEQEEIRGTTTKNTTPQQHDHLLLLRLLLRLLLPLALSHCTFIKRFIIFQAFSDSLRPILCETETQILSHKHARTCAHMHKHAQSAQMNILFYIFDWRGQLLWICYICLSVYIYHIAYIYIYTHTYTSCALISEWITTPFAPSPYAVHLWVAQRS